MVCFHFSSLSCHPLTLLGGVISEQLRPQQNQNNVGAQDVDALSDERSDEDYVLEEPIIGPGEQPVAENIDGAVDNVDIPVNVRHAIV
jgi:hypothetical protein